MAGEAQVAPADPQAAAEAGASTAAQDAHLENLGRLAAATGEDALSITEIEAKVTFAVKAALESGPKPQSPLEEQMTNASFYEKTLRAAEAQGDIFHPRGTVGGWWNKAKDKDPEMAARYLLCPNRKKQQEFKMDWVRTELAVEEHKRVTVFELEDKDWELGGFKPYSVIVRDEGGDLAARAAAYRIVRTCLEWAQQGKTWRGRSLVSWNEWSGRFEFAHIKKTFLSGGGNKFQERVVGNMMAKGGPPPKAAAEAAQGSGSAAALPQAAAVGTSLGSSPPGTPTGQPSRGTPTGPPPPPTPKPAPPPPTTEQLARRVAKKALDAQWKEVTTMKRVWNDALSQYVNVREKIQKDVDWKWAAGWDLNQLDELYQNIVNVTMKSFFWTQFTVTDVGTMKGMMGGKQIEEGMHLLGDMQTKTKAWQQALKETTASHTARMSAASRASKLEGDGTPKAKKPRKEKTAAAAEAAAGVPDVD